MRPNQRPAEELFSAAYDGDLSAAEQADFDRRLAEDPGLQEAYAVFRELMGDAPRLYRDAPVPDLMPGIRKKLGRRNDALRGDRMGQLRARGRIHPLLLACILGTLLLLLWLAYSAIGMLEQGDAPNGPPAAPPAADSDR